MYSRSDHESIKREVGPIFLTWCSCCWLYNSGKRNCPNMPQHNGATIRHQQQFRKMRVILFCTHTQGSEFRSSQLVTLSPCITKVIKSEHQDFMCVISYFLSLCFLLRLKSLIVNKLHALYSCCCCTDMRNSTEP